MFRKILTTATFSATLAGCMSYSPEENFVSRQGGENLYRYGVTHSGVQRTYIHQRDFVANDLCPQGYRILREDRNGTYMPFGRYMQTHILVTIACPA